MKTPTPMRTLAVGAVLAAALFTANEVAADDTSRLPSYSETADPGQGSTDDAVLDDATLDDAVLDDATLGDPALPSPTPSADRSSKGMSQESASTRRIYVGPVDGTGITAVVVIDGSDAAAYLCDGGDYELWLRGTDADGVLLLDGGAASGARPRMVAVVDEGTVSGFVEIDERRLTFSAESDEWPEWAPPAPKLGS